MAEHETACMVCAGLHHTPACDVGAWCPALPQPANNTAYSHAAPPALSTGPLVSDCPAAVASDCPQTTGLAAGSCTLQGACTAQCSAAPAAPAEAGHTPAAPPAAAGGAVAAAAAAGFAALAQCPPAGLATSLLRGVLSWTRLAALLTHTARQCLAGPVLALLKAPPGAQAGLVPSLLLLVLGRTVAHGTAVEAASTCVVFGTSSYLAGALVGCQARPCSNLLLELIMAGWPIDLDCPQQ